MTRTVVTLDDLRPLEDEVVGVLVDWFVDVKPVDWEEALDRVERDLDLFLPDQMDDPVILRVQRIGRDALREARL